MHFLPYFFIWKMGIFEIFRIFWAKITAKKWPKSQKCASTGGLQGAVYRRALVSRTRLLYEKASKLLWELKKQLYSAFWCILDPNFFAWKMGIFGIFAFFGAKITKNQKPGIFKRLKKVQLFIFCAWKIFFQNISAF